MIGKTSQNNEKLVHVIQGKLHFSDDENVVLTTVLGSCVAACLYDPINKVGGMNHFLLPDAGSGASSGNSYGVNAMELLINGMLRLGAQKENMVAKIFGGADMLGIQTSVGQRNISFAQNFLEIENIPCEKESLGGPFARRVRFWPTNGRAQLKILQDHQDIEERPVEIEAKKHDVELF